MIQMLKGLRHRRRAKKFGVHVFTFPDGARLYQLKEDYFERLPNAKLEYIQENANLLAYLGVSKYTFQAANHKALDKNHEAKALIRLKKYAEAEKVLDQQETAIKVMDNNVLEFEKTNHTILVSLFDMFFFFEDEDVFKWTEEALDRKSEYLSRYPYFQNFFFKRVADYQTVYNLTFANATRYAIKQTSLQEVLKDLKSTDISENVTA